MELANIIWQWRRMKVLKLLTLGVIILILMYVVYGKYSNNRILYENTIQLRKTVLNQKKENTTTTKNRIDIQKDDISYSDKNVPKSQMTISHKKAEYLELLDTFIEVTRSLNLPWMLYGPALLRSWFHQGMYFDETLKVLMDIYDKETIEQGLNRLIQLYPHKYTWTQQANGLKIWKKSSSILNQIFKESVHFELKYFTYNATHLWELSGGKTYKSKHIFPLVKRPFDERLVLAPQDTFQVLVEYFGAEYDVCKVTQATQTFYSASIGVDQTTGSCKYFVEKVPFVHRSALSSGGVIEILQLGNRVLFEWYGRELPQSGLLKTYSLYDASKLELTAESKNIPSVDLEKLTAHDSMTKDEKAIELELLDVLGSVLDSIGVTWFISGGSLLGSWRHHSIIPWDDDIDILIDSRYWYDVMNKLDELHHTTKGAYSIKRQGVSKFWSNKSETIIYHNGEKLDWNWPFIDILAFVNDTKQMWHKLTIFHNKHKITNVFPLRKRPFENRLVNTPCNTFAYLLEEYDNDDDCMAARYSHKQESGKGEFGYTKCVALANEVPFIIRTNSPFGGVIEQQKVGKEVLNTWWDRKQPQYVFYNAYSLEPQYLRSQFTQYRKLFTVPELIIVLLVVICVVKLMHNWMKKISHTN